jgi:alkanesulfonate monooxygenase SsuD/methylene tetrahydromethanopterin reductase-like flavin-dependent oxidoreductase (luciferase family)
VRVFERFATLHAATNGRVEVIVGRGWFTESFPLFGYELSQYDALFEEKLSQFANLIRHGTVTRRRLHNQRVYPPIESGTLKTWIAVGAAPESLLRAARYDLPIMLAIIGGESQRFRPFIELYRAAFERLGRPMQAIGVHSAGYVANTDAQACEEFWPHYKRMRDRIGAERGWPPIERTKFEAEVERGSLYVGSPDTVAHKIAMTVKDLGIERFDLRYSVGPLPNEKLLRSIELYGTEVIPLVRDILG